MNKDTIIFIKEMIALFLMVAATAGVIAFAEWIS